MRNNWLTMLCAVGVVSACSNAPVEMTTRAEPGKADRFSEMSGDSDFLTDYLPAGVSLSDLRIGNDDCFYYIQNDTLEPLVFKGEPPGQMCLEI